MKKFELSIPKPCHENWNGMTLEDKGRFCGSCQKTVIDFSAMSDRQIAQFFKQPVGSVCGRFNGDQLERVIEVPKKRIPWVKYFFTIALPAFLLSKKGAAQGEVKITGRIAKCEKPAIKTDTLIQPVQTIKPSEALTGRLGMVVSTPTKPPKTDALTIRGKVSDENGSPLPYVSIQLLGTQNRTMSDSAGNFSLKVQEKSGTPQISSVGFQIAQVYYKDDSFLSVTLQPHRGELMGPIVIMPPKKNKPIPLPPIMKNDTAFSRFSIFPNPVASTSSFTIHTKELEDGRYNLSILTGTGELVQSKDVMISKKAALIYELQNIAAGPYFIRLTNRENSKSYTEILLVK